MPAAKTDILIEQGATFRLSLIYKDANGDPINLTGYSARMNVRLKYSSPEALLSFSTAYGSIVLGGADGTIDIEASAEDTAAATAKPCVYDLELVAPSGDVTRLIEGIANITPEATK